MVVRKSADRRGLRRANLATARLLEELAVLAKPGVRTRELDDHAAAYMKKLGAEPVFHTEAKFPACINTSVNDAILHGVPNDTVLKDGDLISIDAGMRLDTYCGDATITVAIGEVSAERLRLVAAARGSMEAGIAAALPGNRVGDISHAMQSYAEARGFNVVRGFTGHGLGHRMHEEPSIPFAGDAGTGPVLKEGQVITIEPALVEGSHEVYFDKDGWTVRTSDGGWGAQFEHTVLVSSGGAKVLSQLPLDA